MAMTRASTLNDVRPIVGRTLLENPRALRRRVAWPLGALAVVASWCGPTFAIDIVAIEEHWEVEVGEPDPESSGPQVCMVMSPTGSLDGDYFVFTLNLQSDPEYVPGGLQVQQWCGDNILDSRASKSGTLHHDNEVVRWVQRTELHGGVITFEVLAGASESWGDFGDTGALKFTIASSLTTLNGYRPAISLTESGVSFAGNRVRSLVLTKIRWFDAEGNAYELNAPIDIDADLDP
jgi:hypothetical protein